MGRVEGERSRDFSRARYEFKYLAPLVAAERFVERLGDSLERDSNALGESYRVCSLYFDTPELDAYREKLDGVDPRTKIRIRYYTDHESSEPPAYFFVEAKNRRDQLVSKTRVRVPADALADISERPLLDLRLRELCGRASWEAAEELDQLLLLRPLTPWVTVNYRRRAFALRGDAGIRITLDNDLRAFGPAGFTAPDLDHSSTFLPRQLCVVEIKFFWALPHWLSETAREAGLQIRRYSKYAAALEALYPTLALRSLRVAGPA